MERDETDVADVADFAGPQGIPLTLPPHPPEPPTPGFPWIAAIAPAGGAVVLWAITGSALSLVFAALGPVVAFASLLDARRQGRRMQRKGVAERVERLATLRASIGARHELERTEAWQRVASARRILDDRRPLDWRDGDPGQLVLGRGTTRSILRVDGTPADDDDRALLDAAARLDGAPVLAPAARGIGVVGPVALARSAARALLVQVAHRCRPGVVAIAVPPSREWGWATGLPHRRGPSVVRLLDATLGIDDAWAAPRHDAVVIAVAETLDGLPIGLETVVVIASPVHAIVRRRSDGLGGRAIVPSLASVAEAGALASRLATAGDREGVAPTAALPAAVPFDALVQPARRPGSRDTLLAAVGAVAGGPLPAGPRHPRAARDRRGYDGQWQERVPARVDRRAGRRLSARSRVVPPRRLQGRRGLRAGPRPAARHGYRDRPRRGRGGARSAQPACGAPPPRGGPARRARA